MLHGFGIFLLVSFACGTMVSSINPLGPYKYRNKLRTCSAAEHLILVTHMCMLGGFGRLIEQSDPKFWPFKHLFRRLLSFGVGSTIFKRHC